MNTGHSTVVVPRITRTFHKKVRTGCATCKTRRVRCDEKKPACDRCISSGRTCDGYAPAAPRKKRKGPQTPLDSESTHDSWSVSSTARSRSSTPSASTPFSTTYELKLALPRNNHDEVRSFRFFLDVTAPSLSGVFDSEFWNGDIPRTCHADSAMWHAVVCLGAVYESYASTTWGCTTILPRKVPEKSEFALRQFNLAIKHLLNAAHRGEDKWRALAASILFTCICSIQGLHGEARVHLAAGRNLLDELDTENTKLYSQGSGQKPSYSSAHAAVPIPLGSLRPIVTTLDLHARALSNGPLVYKLESLPANDSYTVWRYYQPPPLADENPNTVSARGPGSWQYLTGENLVKANRAAESLFNGILLAQAESVDDIAALTTQAATDKLEMLSTRQAPYKRCYANLTTALHAFTEEMEGRSKQVSDSSGASQSLTRAYLTFKVYHSCIRLFFFNDPEMPELRLDPAKMSAYHKDILDLVERILQLGSPRSSSFIPVPSTTQPLSIVAMSGIPQSNRRRATALLRRYPRREGLWDTMFAAALSDLIMDREKEILAERRESGARAAAAAAAAASADANAGSGKSRGAEKEEEVEKKENDDEEIVEVLDRQYGTRVVFKGERRAEVRLCTWREWMAGQPGKTRLLEW